MPLPTLLWLVGPLVLFCFVLAVSTRRAAQRNAVLEAARSRGRHSEAGLASAMSDALTRLRGQELAHQARYEALAGFLDQLVESLPVGLFVLGRDGNLRVANAEALRWLGLPSRVDGQVLWTLDGTEPLRVVAQECLERMARRDATVAGPGAPDAPVPVTAVPLRAEDGDVDGVLCLVHVERVA
jgi:PAS domain-containing protein